MSSYMVAKQFLLRFVLIAQTTFPHRYFFFFITASISLTAVTYVIAVDQWEKRNLLSLLLSLQVDTKSIFVGRKYWETRLGSFD